MGCKDVGIRKSDFVAKTYKIFKSDMMNECTAHIENSPFKEMSCEKFNQFGLF